MRIYLGREWQGVGEGHPKFEQLQRGAYIGRLDIEVPFEIIDRGRCALPFSPPPEMCCYSYLFWMADASALGITLPPELAKMKWFMAMMGVTGIEHAPVEIRAIIFYPDGKYRPPEEMLKAARAYDDGGIIKPLPR